MKITVNGKLTPYFGRMVIRKTLDSIVDVAVLTFQNSEQARSTFTPGASCVIKSDDESVTYIYGIVECVDIQSNGQIVVTAMDALWPALKYTPNGQTEFVNSTTRSLIQNILSPFGLSVSGLAGVTHKKAVLNVDELVANALYRYVDRAGVFIHCNDSGIAELKNISTASGITLDQKNNLFGFGRKNRFQPPKTKVLTTESSQFEAYSETSGSGDYLDAQVCAGVMSMEEAQNLAKIRNWRVRCVHDCLCSQISPTISLLPGQSVTVKCPTTGIDGQRTVNSLTVDINCRDAKMEKRVELVPDYE